MMIELRDNGGYLEGLCPCCKMAVLLDGGGGELEINPVSARKGLRALIRHVRTCPTALLLDDALTVARLAVERHPTVP